MNLYKWPSEGLRNYSRGCIVVMAQNLHEAKTKAAEKVATYLKANKDWLYDEWNADYLEQELNKFKSDLMVDPVIIESGVLFISGSE